VSAARETNQSYFGALALPSEGRYANEINQFAALLKQIRALVHVIYFGCWQTFPAAMARSLERSL
jgi:hypothetical protein